MKFTHFRDEINDIEIFYDRAKKRIHRTFLNTFCKYIYFSFFNVAFQPEGGGIKSILSSVLENVVLNQTVIEIIVSIQKAFVKMYRIDYFSTEN